MDDRHLTSDLVIVGLTRPPMMMGVPLAAVFLNVLFSSIFFLATGNIFAIVIYGPLHLIAYLMTLKDDRVFHNLLLHMDINSKCPNKPFWGATSYSPLEENQTK